MNKKTTYFLITLFLATFTSFSFCMEQKALVQLNSDDVAFDTPLEAKEPFNFSHWLENTQVKLAESKLPKECVKWSCVLLCLPATVSCIFCCPKVRKETEKIFLEQKKRMKEMRKEQLEQID